MSTSFSSLSSTGKNNYIFIIIILFFIFFILHFLLLLLLLLIIIIIIIAIKIYICLFFLTNIMTVYRPFFIFWMKIWSKKIKRKIFIKKEHRSI